MDENVPKENPPQDLNAVPQRPSNEGRGPAAGSGAGPSPFNKIDLTQLQGFSFGTQWTQDKSAPGERREREDSRSRRESRGPGGPADSPADRRDRRVFRRPEGAPSEGAGAGPGGPGGGPRRDDSRPRHDIRSGGRPGASGGQAGPRPAPYETRVPYDSPNFTVTFYPEDNSFNALVKTVRASCRTIELFEIARTVLGKPERFTVLLTRKDPANPKPGVPPRQTAPVDGGAEAAAEAAHPTHEPIYISAPDALPFEDEESAIGHVLAKHVKLFFDLADVEVEPPKGNFQVINRCGVTGELLGPPNYHRYTQIIQQHFAAKNLRMPFEAFRNRIETVRDPEAVAQWLDKMKKVVRFTWKGHVPEGQPVPFFDTWEDARIYLLAQAKDKVVRSAGHARFHGRELETLPAGEIRRSIEGALERQRRFPLDTANALRGRLRREHFTIFKKGAKGVSYVCAVKRKFRTPGQVFADSIGALISFIETHPIVKAGDLPRRFLDIPIGGTAEGEAAGPVASELTIEQREKVARLQADLLWLVREGYVTEFIDGTLYAPAPMVEARKKEAEHEDLDPENFPEGAPETAASPPESAAGGEVSDSFTANPEAEPAEPVPAAAAPASEPPPAEAPLDVSAPLAIEHSSAEAAPSAAAPLPEPSAPPEPPVAPSP